MTKVQFLWNRGKIKFDFRGLVNGLKAIKASVSQNLITAPAILAKRQRAYFSSATHSWQWLPSAALKLMQIHSDCCNFFPTEFSIDHRWDLEAGNERRELKIWGNWLCVSAMCTLSCCGSWLQGASQALGKITWNSHVFALIVVD